MEMVPGSFMPLTPDLVPDVNEVTMTRSPSYPDLRDGVTILPDLLRDGLRDEVERHRFRSMGSERHQPTSEGPGCRPGTHMFFTIRGEDT